MARVSFFWRLPTANAILSLITMPDIFVEILLGFLEPPGSVIFSCLLFEFSGFSLDRLLNMLMALFRLAECNRTFWAATGLQASILRLEELLALFAALQRSISLSWAGRSA